MTIRELAPRLALSLIALSALGLLAEMSWSLWKFHAFTPMFWVLAWMVIVLAFLLRSQTRAAPPNSRQTLVGYAVAFAISITGWAASPAVNAWIQSW